MIPTILIAAASAACPNNVSLVQDTGGDGNVLNQYCTGYVDGGIINLTNTDGWLGNMADLTDEKLCAPATEEYPCCSYIFYKAGIANTHRCYDTEGPVNSAMYNWIGDGLVCSATRQEYLWWPSSPDRYEVIRNCMLSASSPAPPPALDVEAIGALATACAQADLTECRTTCGAAASCGDHTVAYLTQQVLSNGPWATCAGYQPCQALQTTTATTTQTLTATATGTATATSTVTTTETPAPPAEDSGLSAGAIAGIAVGAVLAVVAAGVVLL